MAYQHAIAGCQGRYADPTIRKVGTPDVFDVLAKRVVSFKENATQVAFPTRIYPLANPLRARPTFGYAPLPPPMLLWGLVVAVGLLVGFMPFLVGLCVVLAALRHATWPPYRAVVAW